MADPIEQPSPVVTTTEPRAPRSGGSVLAILGALIALPLLAIALVLLLRGSGDGAADAATAGVRSARIQSVQLTDGSLLFGRLKASDGDWLILRDAYFLRRSDATAADAKDAKSSGTELVPVSAQQGGDGDVVINAREVVAFQNLSKGSDIGGQIEDATR